MRLTYEECQLLAQWFNTLNVDVDKIPDNVRLLLERLNKIVESPEAH